VSWIERPGPVPWELVREPIPDPHAYQTDARPGVRRLGVAHEVVGANGRRILVAASPEGVWLGSVLIAGPGALLNLADLLRGFAVDDSGRGGR
jgi:hypothetical protein